MGQGMFPCRDQPSVCCGRSSLGAVSTINVCIFEMAPAYFHFIVGNIVFIEPQFLSGVVESSFDVPEQQLRWPLLPYSWSLQVPQSSYQEPWHPLENPIFPHG